MTTISTIRLPRRQAASRHDHIVRRFGLDIGLLEMLSLLGADRTAAATLINAISLDLGVATPSVTFHASRGPHTGYCMGPRDVLVARHGVGPVTAWETKRNKAWPVNGMIRLGDPASLSTVAHEFGHHLVHVLDRPTTPSHGKVWVGRFDMAGAAIAKQMRIRSG